MKQQTAVQMLISRLPNIDWSDPYYRDILNEAIHQEKEQIMDAHGNKTKKSAGVTNYIYTLTGEQYYNETYKTNEQ